MVPLLRTRTTRRVHTEAGATLPLIVVLPLPSTSIGPGSRGPAVEEKVPAGGLEGRLADRLHGARQDGRR